MDFPKGMPVDFHGIVGILLNTSCRKRASLEIIAAILLFSQGERSFALVAQLDRAPDYGSGG